MSKPIRKERWTNIDVFGLLNGISIWDSQYKTLKYVRRPFDTPLDIKDKVLRTGSNPPGIDKQGLYNGLSNEFGYNTYNVQDRTIFNLTYNPIPSGNINTQDIFVYYRERNATGEWTELLPQIWSNNYHQAIQDNTGFIVWQNSKYTNLSGVKDFTYFPLLEIIETLPDNCDIQVEYWVRIIDENSTNTLVKYTDAGNLNDPNDLNFVYRSNTSISPLSGIVAYTLDDIPTGVYSFYYDNFNKPKELLYSIKEHLDKQFKHKWKDLENRSTIWDVHKGYGSGEIPHYYDAYVPLNNTWCIGSGKLYGSHFSGYAGGVEELTNSLYLMEINEQDNDIQNWFIKVYPGKFYIDGIPYRMFENPSLSQLTFISGVADIPSGLTRGMYTILANSGYYDGCTSPDPYLSGFVYEDYQYFTGEGADSLWSFIYRHRPFLNTNMGYDITLELGEYNIDFDSGKIYLNSTETNATLIWENNIVPSGRIIEYDVNPLNDSVLNLQKYFMYLANKE